MEFSAIQSTEVLYLFVHIPDPSTFYPEEIVLKRISKKSASRICIKLPENIRIYSREDDWPDVCVNLKNNKSKHLTLYYVP